MVEFVLPVVVVGLVGYFMGSIISKEDIFDGLRRRAEDFFYDDCDEEQFHQNKLDNVYRDAGLNDGYRLDIDNRWLALTMGKVGDVITCPKCSGVWVSFAVWVWLYNLSDAINWETVFSIPALGVSGAIILFLNDFLN